MSTSSPRSASPTPSTSSSHSSASLTSIFESSLTLLGSLPVAATSSSPSRPIIHTCSKAYSISTSSSSSKGKGKGKGKQLKLYLPDVNTFEEVRLQSHLLWPAGVQLGAMIESLEIPIQDETVLELGAGAGLPSLLAVLGGAEKVTITDYPAPGILDTLRKNVEVNLDEEQRGKVDVVGLDWAEESTAGALEGLRKAVHGGYTRILAADTLWISSLHAAQVKVMTSLLSHSASARIHVLAGMHTGRHCVRNFVSLCLEAGLVIHCRKIWDRLDSNWTNQKEAGEAEEEEEEGTEESRRRWLVYIELGWSDPILGVNAGTTCT